MYTVKINQNELDKVLQSIFLWTTAVTYKFFFNLMVADYLKKSVFEIIDNSLKRNSTNFF